MQNRPGLLEAFGSGAALATLAFLGRVGFETWQQGWGVDGRRALILLWTQEHLLVWLVWVVACSVGVLGLRWKGPLGGIYAGAVVGVSLLFHPIWPLPVVLRTLGVLFLILLGALFGLRNLVAKLPLQHAVWGLLTLLGVAVAGIPGPSADPERPDIILITVDTLRADHLSSYGYHRPTSPNLDALAARGVRFEHANSQAPWTLPAMGTLMSGTYPQEHGAYIFTSPLPPEQQTLAERAQAVGYATIGVCSSLFTSAKYGFSQGYDVFDESAIPLVLELGSPHITATALNAVAEADPNQPMLLWVHYFDPHYPFIQHDDWPWADPADTHLPNKLRHYVLTEKFPTLTPDDFAYIRSVYDEEIAYTDRHIGALLEGLKTRNRPAVIALTADHGEQLGERGRFGHAEEGYDELLRVPLIVAGPGFQAGQVVSTPVETSWVFDTLVNVAGAEAHNRGTDLRKVASGAPAVPIYSHVSKAWNDDTRGVVVVDDGHKLWRRNDEQDALLFDLTADPREHSPLVGDPREAELAGLLDAFERKDNASSSSVDVTGSEREMLEELGYLD